MLRVKTHSNTKGRVQVKGAVLGNLSNHKQHVIPAVTHKRSLSVLNNQSDSRNPNFRHRNVVVAITQVPPIQAEKLKVAKQDYEEHKSGTGLNVKTIRSHRS